MKSLDPQKLLIFLTNSPLFNLFEERALKAIIPSLTPVFLSGGDYLIKEQTAGDGLYILESGRLVVSKKHANGVIENLGEIARGEIVGEIALILKTKRKSSVRAVRDCTLYKLDTQTYEFLCDKYPKSALEIMKFCLNRVLSKTSLHSQNQATTFVFVPLSDHPDCKVFVEKFSTLLNMYGATLHLNESNFNRGYGTNAALTSLNSELTIPITNWLHEQELKYRYIVYETSASYNDWTLRCLRQADKIILVGRSGDDPSLNQIDEILSTDERLQTVEKTLILLSNSHLQGVNEWKTPRQMIRHYNLQLDTSNDYTRIIRILTGNSTGLVLSGGGLRTLGYLGLFRALEELKIPIDMIGGTSAGAILGACYAMGMDSKFILEEYKHWIKRTRLLFNYTLPLLSVWNGAFITHLLQHLFKDTNIEDMSVPFFCISSNSSLSQMNIHREGKLWLAIRASVAIPGIFPPIINSEGQILVDGGITNNFPVDVMRSQFNCAKIIGGRAIPKTQKKFSSINPICSGWHLLIEKLFRSNKDTRIPTISDVIMSSLSLASNDHDNKMHKDTDININFHFEDVGWFDFKRNPKALVDAGYQVSIEKLKTHY